MADIFADVDSIVNGQTMELDSIVTLFVEPTEIINTNSISDGEITLYVEGNSIVNTNTVSNVSNISFIILPQSIDNISIIPNASKIDYLSVNILATSIVDADVVPDGSFFGFFQLGANSIENSSQMGGISGVSVGKSYEVDSIINGQIIPSPMISFETLQVVGKEYSRNTPNRLVKKDFAFKDISLDFLLHPITGDIASLYDVNAINQSLRNIILTKKFERPFDSYDISSQVRDLLFELSDNSMLMEIRSELFGVIMNHEPRINIVNIIVNSAEYKHSVQIQIFYRIKTFDNIEVFDELLTRS